MSVVRDGEILTARGYGSADTGLDGGNRTSVDGNETLFRIGSISKTVTATAVMKLVETGDVDLDADVNDYLDFTLPESSAPITLRNLLSHTAGFEEKLDGTIEPTGSTITLRDYITQNPPEVVYPTGSVPSYSNYGNALAGYIVERVSGVTFADFVQRNVLDPAGMGSSTFEQPLPERLQSRTAQGYADVSQPVIPFEFVGAAPAGAFSATASDMGRYMLAQLDDLPDGRMVLQPETLDLMHSPALDEDSLGTLASVPRMTLGFFDESRNGHKILGHLGDTQGFHSAMEIFPEDGAGIFVSMNSTGAGGEAGLIRAAVMDGFTDRYFPANGGADIVSSIDEQTSREHAALAAGTYETSRSAHSTFPSMVRLVGQTKVTALRDGSITITPGLEGGGPSHYRETAPWVWTEVGGVDTIAMRVDDGEVTTIGYASAFTLLRVDGPHDASLTVPVVVGSLAVLLLSLLVVPIGWLMRRWYSVPPVTNRIGRLLPVLTRVAAAAVMIAAAGWLTVLSGLLGYQAVPDALIRTVQIVQVIGVLGTVPAVLALVAAIRSRERLLRILGRLAVVLAFISIAVFSVVFQLISPDITY